MILGMSVGAFTILHVTITLVAIGRGLIIVGGMFASNSLPVTTVLFLFTTALTSLTGFLFPNVCSKVGFFDDSLIAHPRARSGMNAMIRPKPGSAIGR
jgi:hypothetical protein